ncbi:Uma2 family endonuclease [Okeania sp.]|uniref:Uma2 family endonuclease n=1 Tax=Okeania sp. TaxID=3100323 RepID=UPI0035C8CA3C
MAKGIEPDNCFYIENEAKVRGKECLDLTVDTPPDLAIEIDVTSRTHTNIYASLGVRELWRFEGRKLEMYILENTKYIESKFSLHFPDLPLIEIIPEYCDRCKIIGRNQTMKIFRNWVREQI